MNQLNEINKFCEAFDAKTEKSEHRFYVKTRVDPADYLKPIVDYRTEVVSAVAIHIPEHRLDDFLDMFDERRYRDMEIRLQVPAVKKAYEHYKLLLNMCRGDFDA